MLNRNSVALAAIALLTLAPATPARGQFKNALDTGASLNVRSVLQTQDTVMGISFAKDGSSLWCVAGLRAMLWDLSSVEPKKVMKYHSDAQYGDPEWHPDVCMAMATSRDGKTIATGDYRGRVKVWDAATGAVKATGKGSTTEIQSLAFSPDGQTLVGGCTDTMYVWNAATLATKATLDIKNGGHMRFIAYSPDGKTIFTGGSGGRLSLWNAATGTLKRTIQVPIRGITGIYEDMSAAALSPNGALIVTGGQTSGFVIDVATGKVLGRLPHEGQVYGVAFSHDGKYVATSSFDMTVKLWDAATCKVKATLKGPTVYPSKVLAFSPDSKVLATGWANALRLSDVP
ncbi:MAG: WD40 repeat domain-containing protein [Fimbriimonadales bacterium]